MPSRTGIFTSRITRSGRSSSASSTARLAVRGLADDVVPLLGEHLGEVHADQRLVLGDDDAARLRDGHRVRLSGADPAPPIR